METIGDKNAVGVDFSEKFGWGIVLEGDFGQKRSIFPKLASKTEAEAYMAGWNYCRRSIANEMLNKSVRGKR